MPYLTFYLQNSTFWRADERTRTAYPCSLRVNCSYWMILCFTLLNDRRNQRERWSVMRRNERLVVCVLVFERIGEGAGNVFAGISPRLPSFSAVSMVPVPSSSVRLPGRMMV